MKKAYVSANKDRENEKWFDKPTTKGQRDRKNKRHKLEEEDGYKVQRNSRRRGNAFDRHVSRCAMGYDLDEYNY